MKYKDYIDLPDIRELGSDYCYNCGKFQAEHYGWACYEYDSGLNLNELTFSKRLYTIDMEGLGWVEPSTFYFKKDKAKNNFDTDDWRAWAHQEPGNCPCGVSRRVCDYHRDRK